ncbi:MAG: trigger factor [Elstera sp.]
MQVTETLAEGLKRQYKIAVPADYLETQVNAKLAELAKKVSVPGFRPGKVPMNLVRQRYLGSVMGEVLEATVQQTSNKAIEERGIRPAFQPKVNVESFELESGVQFTMDVEILPEITVADFATLEIERPTAPVADEDVDKGLEKLRSESRATKKVEEARPARSGDTVVIDFVGKDAGEPFQGGSGTDFQLVLGSGMFIPGFEEQLIGASVGDEKVLNVTFPAEYHAENLKGKPVTFDVTVKEIREPEQAELNDEFAKAFGLESLDALKTAIRGQIEREYAAAGRLKAKRILLDKLDTTHGFDVPPTLEEAEFNAIWNQFEQAKAAGEKDPMLDGKSDDDVREEYKRIANRRVRLGLLLAEIGRLNNIQVEDQEIRAAIFNVARQYPGQERQVLEFFSSNQDAITQIRGPIFEDKVVDHILTTAKVTDKTVTPEELLKADAE